MLKRYLVRTIVCGLFPVVSSATANEYFALRPTVTLETGDSWVAAGKHYRLFGVQSFPYGMTVTNRAAEKQDLGDASVAILAAYIKDTGPICTQVLSTADIVYVTCYALIGGQYLDLAMILISSGFATASLHQNGQPLYAPYASAESKAWQHRAGLWQFMPKIEH